MEAGALSARDGRSALERPSLSRWPDKALKWGLTGLSAAILALLAFFFIRLYTEANPVFSKFGIFDFIFRNNWDVAHETYGALAMVVGTLITSALALVMGVPIAIAVALYSTELCPERLRGTLSSTVNLLAAVPSVVYGLWGIYFLIPAIKPAMQWFADTFSFLPFVGGHVAGPGYFVAGLILAIMITPIVSAISREVILTVPSELKEGALALGATRWEMIRMAILPYSRPGITGGAMLGLGRAIGETIAVAIVIGGAPTTGSSIFSQGNTLAAVIANEFNEAASDPLHRAALIGAGLVLFVLTLGVNAIARYFIIRSPDKGVKLEQEAFGVAG